MENLAWLGKAGLLRKRWVGKNRSVQEGLDMKIVTGLGKISLLRRKLSAPRLALIYAEFYPCAF